MTLTPLVRIIIVPQDLSDAPHGTRFKARANHYAHELRIEEGEARHDVWVLHMDDDTGVGPDTAAALAQFINRQHRLSPEAAKHIAQGILDVPARARASAVSPGSPTRSAPPTTSARFRALTGLGTPAAGVHGELLLLRARYEAAIGWDFGPKAIVEDAQLALRFCGASRGRATGSRPLLRSRIPRDLARGLRQTARTLGVGAAWNLLTQPSISLRRRLLFMPTSPLGRGAVRQPDRPFAVGFLIEDPYIAPVDMLVGLAGPSISGFYIWLYWEGFKINVSWSERNRIVGGNRSSSWGAPRSSR